MRGAWCVDIYGRKTSTRRDGSSSGRRGEKGNENAFGKHKFANVRYAGDTLNSGALSLDVPVCCETMDAGGCHCSLSCGSINAALLDPSAKEPQFTCLAGQAKETADLSLHTIPSMKVNVMIAADST